MMAPRRVDCGAWSVTRAPWFLARQRISVKLRALARVNTAKATGFKPVPRMRQLCTYLFLLKFGLTLSVPGQRQLIEARPDQDVDLDPDPNPEFEPRREPHSRPEVEPESEPNRDGENSRITTPRTFTTCLPR